MNFESVCFHHSCLCFRGRKFIFQALFPPQNFANLLFPISPQSKKILMQLILEGKNCNMLGWILGSFQIYLSHFNHSPLRYSWVDNLIFRSNWNLEMLIFDEREKRRRKTKNNNFNLKPQLASMARLKFIDHWREASVSYHCAIRKLLRSRSFLGSLVVSES